ncbi:MAG: hypothetical protein R3B54_08290 [Bdellovibrionota bacterium]
MLALALFVLNSWTAVLAIEIPLEKIDPKNPEHMKALRTSLGNYLAKAYVAEEPDEAKFYLAAAHRYEKALYDIVSKQSEKTPVIDETVIAPIRSAMEKADNYSEAEVQQISSNLTRLADEGVARHVFSKCGEKSILRIVRVLYRVLQVARGGKLFLKNITQEPRKYPVKRLPPLKLLATTLPPNLFPLR